MTDVRYLALVKEKALVKEIRSEIIRKQYDEIDILGLLILLRRYSSAGSATYEFANFVAHRERDRGVINDYLVKGIEEVSLALKAKPPPGGPKYGSVYSFHDLKDSLNQALSMIGIATVDSLETNDILLCIMCLLQGVRIVSKKKGVIGKLQLLCSGNHIQLYGSAPFENIFISFPVLHVPNLQNNRLNEFEHTKSVRGPGRQNWECRVFNNVISARCHNGNLTLFQGDPLAAVT